MNISKNLICLLFLLIVINGVSSAQNFFKSIASTDPIKKERGGAVIDEKELSHKLWNRVYLRKIIQVSPRVHYGFGNFQSRMSYQVPNLEVQVAEVANNLRARYPWVPWKDINLNQEAHILRTRTIEQRGRFFGTVGINIPIFFIDLEVGAGRFSQPLFTTEEAWPPQNLFKAEELIDLMIKRATTAESKASMTLRVGVELERLLPDPWRPRLTYKILTAGIDVEGYFLIGGDYSYRAGAEVIAPNAVEDLQDLFKGIPLVPANAKKEAAEIIVGQIESSLPTYFWLPGMRGFGLSGEAYLDVGNRLRIKFNYNHEWARGLKVKSAEWLKEGPAIERTFLTIGITTQI